jgi:Ca2+-binding EF-hand superfamily protein
MTNREPKKTELIEFRISHEAKSAFLDQCRRDDRSASEVIRELMQHHVDDHSERDQQPAEWKSDMTALLKKHPISASAICALSLLGMSAVSTTAAADPAQAFGAIDSNGDKYISMEEYIAASEPVAALAMNSDGSNARVLTKAEARSLLARDYLAYDENSDGKVDEREFMPRFDITTRISFYAIDLNGDGAVTRDELSSFSNGAADELARLEGSFQALDVNGNGSITLQEYQIVRL